MLNFNSNDNHFVRDFSIILFVALISYLVDVKKNKDLYKNCENTLIFRAVLLFHHFIWTFALFAVISCNRQLLKIYVVIVIIYLAHWQLNNDKCFITEWSKQYCKLGNDHILQYFTETVLNSKPIDRKSQKYTLLLSLVIALIKINN